ncbi:MAG: DUF3368 domain-containing protein [Calditrichota bacterium]
MQKINELSILEKLYTSVSITPQIAEEYGTTLPGWISIEIPEDQNYQEILETSLDPGEASAIALALGNDNSLLIIADLKGRRIAVKLGLKITGSLGVLISAKKKGHLKSIKPILKKIKASDFRISPKLEEVILKLSDE